MKLNVVKLLASFLISLGVHQAACAGTDVYGRVNSMIVMGDGSIRFGLRLVPGSPSPDTICGTGQWYGYQFMIKPYNPNYAAWHAMLVQAVIHQKLVQIPGLEGATPLADGMCDIGASYYGIVFTHQ